MRGGRVQSDTRVGSHISCGLQVVALAEQRVGHCEITLLKWTVNSHLKKTKQLASKLASFFFLVSLFSFCYRVRHCTWWSPWWWSVLCPDLWRSYSSKSTKKGLIVTLFTKCVNKSEVAADWSFPSWISKPSPSSIWFGALHTKKSCSYLNLKWAGR